MPTESAMSTRATGHRVAARPSVALNGLSSVELTRFASPGGPYRRAEGDISWTGRPMGSKSRLGALSVHRACSSSKLYWDLAYVHATVRIASTLGGAAA